MIDGEWDDVHRARVPHYAFENPMYSPMLRRWKREHLRAVANAGAPDLWGIRSEARAASRNKPVGYFRTRSDPWQPPVAGEAKAVRVLIRAAANFMIDRAKLRERVILSILADSGPRLHATSWSPADRDGAEQRQRRSRGEGDHLDGRNRGGALPLHPD